MKTATVLFALAIVSLAIIGCVQSGQPAATTPPSPSAAPSTMPSAAPAASTTPSAAPSDAQAAVSIDNFAFSPATLTVAVGTTVTWTNNDAATHTVSSDAFTSPDLGKGSAYAFTFTTPGTYPYSCGIHPSMAGTVIVK